MAELVWWDVLDYQMRIADRELGGVPYGLATVICPCKNAEIMVNNQAVTGEVRVSSGSPQVGSSAFLAFSETWVERT